MVAPLPIVGRGVLFSDKEYILEVTMSAMFCDNPKCPHHVKANELATHRTFTYGREDRLIARHRYLRADGITVSLCSVCCKAVELVEYDNRKVS